MATVCWQSARCAVGAAGLLVQLIPPGADVTLGTPALATTPLYTRAVTVRIRPADEAGFSDSHRVGGGAVG